MEENNKLIVFEQDKLISKVSNSLRIANKLLPIINEPELIPYRKGDKWGFCTPDKKIFIDCIYDDAYQFVEGLAKVKQNNKYGFINKQGNEIIPFVYDRAQDFYNGKAAVEYDKKIGVINYENDFILRGVTKENKEITVTVNHTKLNPISIIMLLNADI